MTIKCIVAAVNASGEPDFFFCKVECSKEQYDNGEHYEAAEELAEEEGYEPKLAYDERDPAGRAMLELLDWRNATIVTAG